MKNNNYSTDDEILDKEEVKEVKEEKTFNPEVFTTPKTGRKKNQGTATLVTERHIFVDVDGTKQRVRKTTKNQHLKEGDSLEV